MRIPLFWLQEWLPGEPPLSLQEVESGLERLGVEIEGISPTLPAGQQLTVGCIEQIERHPKLPTLRIAQVFDGTRVQRVITGADNCRAGLKVAYAPAGARLASGLRVDKREFCGWQSEGLLCGWEEIGLPPEGAGLVELPENAMAGQQVALWLDEPILELGITPNLGHLLNVRGIARDLAQLLGRRARDLQSAPAPTLPADDRELRMRVDTPDCTALAYCELQIDPSANRLSPGWMKRRLHQCGFRSTDLIIDITNYVMIELGQPLHAYSLKVDEVLTVRAAKADRQMRGIDQRVYALRKGDLVVELRSGKVASLAGILGADETGISQNSESILLEAAQFAPSRVQRTSRHLGCLTEAAKRFERGSDAAVVLPALARAKELLEAAGIAKISSVRSVKLPAGERLTLPCRLKRVNQVLGANFTLDQLGQMLARLQLAPEAIEGGFACRIPSYRRDLTQEIDLVTEVIRLIGLKGMAKRPLHFSPSQLGHDSGVLSQERVRGRCKELGFCEIVTDCLIGSEWLEGVAGQVCEPYAGIERCIQVRRSKSTEHTYLRSNLLPGFLQVSAQNSQRGNHRLRLFEVASIYGLDGGGGICETPAVGLLATSSVDFQSWTGQEGVFSYYHLKGKIEALCRALGLQNLRSAPGQSEALHPGRQAILSSSGQVIGAVGQVHPELADAFDIKCELFFCQLLLEKVVDQQNSSIGFQIPSPYPSSERDWTLTLKEEIPFEYLRDLIPSRDLLFSVTLLDIYQSPRLGAGRKNLTLRFCYASPRQTLSQDQVDLEHAHIVKAIVQQLSGDLLDANLTPIRSREIL